MVRVVVLGGGISLERAVSLRSAKAIKTALQNLGHSVISIDPSDGLKQHITTLKCADVIFPALHGKEGEDGSIQAFLESLNVPFVGSDSIASELCFDKPKYKSFIAAKGLPVAQSDVVTNRTIWTHKLAKKPFVLKPKKGGSSIDTFIIRDVTKVDTDAIKYTLGKYGSMMIENLIVGTEVTVGVLDKTALPVIEIIPPANAEFNYINKYNGATQELIPPIHVSEKTQRQAQKYALAAHNFTKCRDLSRTDFMIDKQNNLFVLETNTMPGMTQQSLFPKQALHFGMSMEQLCQKLIDLALAR